MRFVTKLGVFALLGALAVSCGGDKKGSGILGGGSPSTGGTPAGATPPVGSGTPGGTATTGALAGLSLVYIDSRNSTPQLFAARSDGTSPRKVVDLKQGTRVLDMRNGLVLAGGGADNLAMVDLKDGKTTEVKPTGNVTDARFLDADTIVFVTSGSCGPNRVKALAQTMSIKDGAKKELLSSDGTTITIAGLGKDGGLALSPRGCDVGVSEVVHFSNARSGGAPASRTETRGCGWVIASPDSLDAVVSWKSCTVPDNRKDIDATVYALGPNARAPRDLKAPAGGANPMAWVMRPGGKEAAMATSQTTGTGPGSTRSSGLWLVDLRTGDFKDLAPAAGAEQFPVSWTPDGRYLLAASVQAQGLCSFSIVDANEKRVTPLPDGLTFCGPNGLVLGWTVVR